MSLDSVTDDDARKRNRYPFERHSTEYREKFLETTQEMHEKCPVAWSD
ncbi:cytochrome P450, partial [Streptomyces sp. SID10244]|nr:cytochrome P450 [Streptomyces sp. SID10244]